MPAPPVGTPGGAAPVAHYLEAVLISLLLRFKICLNTLEFTFVSVLSHEAAVEMGNLSVVRGGVTMRVSLEVDSEVQALGDAFPGTTFTLVGRVVSVGAGDDGAAGAGELAAALLQLGVAVQQTEAGYTAVIRAGVKLTAGLDPAVVVAELQRTYLGTTFTLVGRVVSVGAGNDGAAGAGELAAALLRLGKPVHGIKSGYTSVIRAGVELTAGLDPAVMVGELQRNYPGTTFTLVGRVVSVGAGNDGAAGAVELAAALQRLGVALGNQSFAVRFSKIKDSDERAMAEAARAVATDSAGRLRSEVAAGSLKRSNEARALWMAVHPTGGQPIKVQVSQWVSSLKTTDDPRTGIAKARLAAAAARAARAGAGAGDGADLDAAAAGAATDADADADAGAGAAAAAAAAISPSEAAAALHADLFGVDI